MKDEPRTAKSIIDSAISENKRGLWLLYFISSLVVIGGLGVLIAGVFSGSGLTSIVGAVSTAMFIPTMTVAGKYRRENVALRLLEAPLSRSDTAKEASQALCRYFVDFPDTAPEQTSISQRGESNA